VTPAGCREKGNNNPAALVSPRARWSLDHSVPPYGAAQPLSAALLAYRNELGQTGGTGRWAGSRVEAICLAADT